MAHTLAKALVLVVEDDSLVRMDAAEMMEGLGYAVVEAGDAVEAIRLLESRLAVTVMLTDVEMPGSMNGLKLAQAVRERWPPIKIIVTSGQVKLDEGELPDGGRFLPKPYTHSQFRSTLREMTELPGDASC
jgi:CheY-like chemotaxis protein